MDPDFMKRGNADRPFGPAQEQPLLRWIATVLVLLALVYAGYKVWESSSNPASPPKTRQAAPTTSQPSPPPKTLGQPQPAAPTTPAPGTRIVTKCVVNGKTIYSDNACPQGAAGTQVVTKADHNLMTGLTPAQMAAADRIQRARHRSLPLPKQETHPRTAPVNARHWMSTSNTWTRWPASLKACKRRTGYGTSARKPETSRHGFPAAKSQQDK